MNTIQQAAKEIGLHPKTLRRWEESGKFIPQRTMGNQRRYSPADIAKLKAIKSGESLPEKPLDKILTLDEAAAKLHVSTATLRRWTKQGKLKIKVNDALEPGYSLNEINQVLGKQKILPPEPIVPLPAKIQPVAPQHWYQSKHFHQFTAAGAALAFAIAIYLAVTSPDKIASPSVEQLNLTQGVEFVMPRTASFLDGGITIGLGSGSLSFLDDKGNIYARGAALIEDSVHTASLQLLPSDRPENQIGRQYVDSSTGDLMYFDGTDWISLNQTSGSGGSTLQDIYDTGNTTLIGESQDIDITLGSNVASSSATSLNLTLAGNLSTFKVLGGASQEIISFDDDAIFPVTISQPTQIKGNLYASELIDNDNANYYLDPGNTAVSLNIAGSATISGTLKFADNGEYLHNGTNDYLISSAGLGVGGGTTYGLTGSGNLNVKKATFNDTATFNGEFRGNGQMYLGDGGDAITINSPTITFTDFESCTALETDSSGVLTCGSDDTGGGGDADTLDSLDSTAFLRSNTSDSFTSGTLTFDAGTTLAVNGTLTAANLTVDNLSLNGNVFSSTTGDIDVTPISGSNLDIDVAGGGEIQLDGGLVDIGSGTYVLADGDNDLGVAGDLEVLGNLRIDGTTTFNTVAYTWPGADGSSGYVLTTDGAGTLSWTDQGTLGTNYWRLASGALSPVNDTLDLLIGSNATASAKFAVLNVNDGTPTASIAGSTAGYGMYLTGDGTLATTLNRSLLLNPTGGNVGIGTPTPATKLEIVDTTTVPTFTGNNQQGLRVQGNSASGSYSLIGFTGYSGATEKNIAQIGARYGGLGSWLYFGTSNSYASGITNQAMVIDYNANVGIGTTAPDARLEINHATGDNLRLTYNDADGTAANYTDFSLSSDGDLILDSSGGDIISLDYLTAPGATLSASVAGNVPLTVKGATSQTANLLEIQDSSSNVLAGIQGRGTLISDLGTAVTNFFVGFNAGNTTTTGGYNTAIGYTALDALTDGTYNTGIGYSALGKVDGGDYNIGIGPNSGASITTGNSNIGIGVNTLTLVTTGSNNVALGAASLNAVTGSNNTALGTGAGQKVTTGSNSIFLGSYAGYNQTTLSNLFIVDNQNYPGRASAAEELTNSILYGVMASTPGSQSLRINAVTSINGAYTLPIVDGSANYILQTDGSGTLSWADPTGAAASAIPWVEGAGILYPKNSTVDLLVGGQATASAKFAVLNVNDGTPTASVSGATLGQGGSFFTGAGAFGTIDQISLTVGGATTGNILFQPNSDTTDYLQLTSDGTDLTLATTDSSALNITAAGAISLDGTGASNVSATSGNLTLSTVTTGDLILTAADDLVFTGFNCSGNTNGGALTADASGIISCTDDDSGSSNGSNWRISEGAISPINDTLDLLIGSNASASAKFAVLNVNDGTPTASISANSGNIATYLTGLGALQTTNRQTLSLGGDTTGLVQVKDTSGTAFTTFDTVNSRVGIGTTTPLAKLVVAGANAITSFTGTTALGFSTQGALSANDYSGIDFRNTGQSSAPIARIASYAGGSGSYLQFGTSNNYTNGITNTSMTINYLGNVGIGDTTPGTHLVVGSDAGLSIADAAGNAYFAGAVEIDGQITLNNIAYTFPAADDDANYILQTDGSGTLSWVDPAEAAASASPWVEGAGILYPKNSTVDLLVGGQATTSAKFAVLNVNDGTPTASVSAGTAGAAYLTADGNLATTAKQALTLAGGDSGDIFFHGSTYQLNTTGDLTLGGRITFENAGFIQNEANGTLVINEPTLQFDAATALDFNSPSIDLSTQTVDVSLNNAIDALNFDSDTLSIDAAGNKIGIGNAAPDAKLQVTGKVTGKALVIFDETGDQDIFAASASGSTRFRVATDGHVYAQRFVDTADTNYYIDPAASGTSIMVSGDIISDGAFSITSNATGGNITLNAGAGTVIIGDGTGKLDAGTVDPPYTINGLKYATYMSGMTGVKEETTGIVETNYGPYGYSTTIDFKSLPIGSDLWLFSQTADIKKHLADMVVLLSPAGNARTWYTIDSQKYLLTIYSSQPTQVSYRLTAPRFDADTWTNTRDSGSTGFVINTDQLQENINGVIIGLQNGMEEIFETIRARNKIIAPTVETATLVTDFISPLSDDRTITIAAKTIIEGELEVATIAAETITAEDITTDTLTAREINSSTIDNIREKIAALAENYAFQTATAGANLEGSELLANLEPIDASQSANLSLETVNATAGFFSEYLAVLGSATITDLSVSNTLNVSQNLVFTANSITALDNQLFFQPTGEGSINFLAGLLTLDGSGQVQINGDLTVTGTIIASQISAPEFEDLAISIASGSAVSIYNAIGENVSQIDASGSGSFATLNLKASGSSQIVAGENHVIIASADLSLESQIIVTFTANYSPATKYWVTKDPANGQFTIFVNYPVNSDTTVDWLVIN